jgi:hypothetical protein
MLASGETWLPPRRQHKTPSSRVFRLKRANKPSARRLSRAGMVGRRTRRPWKSWTWGTRARLHSTWSDVAVDLSVRADEDDAVTGRIAVIPFHLVIGDGNLGTVGDHSLTIGDDGDVVVALNLVCIGFERVRLPATGHPRVIRLHELLVPLPYSGVRAFPLPVVSGEAAGGTKCKSKRKSEGMLHAGLH